MHKDASDSGSPLTPEDRQKGKDPARVKYFFIQELFSEFLLSARPEAGTGYAEAYFYKAFVGCVLRCCAQFLCAEVGGVI